MPMCGLPERQVNTMAGWHYEHDAIDPELPGELTKTLKSREGWEYLDLIKFSNGLVVFIWRKWIQDPTRIL